MPHNMPCRISAPATSSWIGLRIFAILLLPGPLFSEVPASQQERAQWAVAFHADTSGLVPTAKLDNQIQYVLTGGTRLTVFDGGDRLYAFSAGDSLYVWASGRKQYTAPGGRTCIYDPETKKLLWSMQGEILPPFRVVEGVNSTLDIASLKGNVVLILFWAIWCQYCRVDMPHYQELLEKYRGKGFQVVAVNVDGSLNAHEVLALEGSARGETKKPLAFRFTACVRRSETECQDLDRFGFSGIPAVMIVDRSGKIRFSGQRLEQESLLRQVIEEGSER